MPSLPTSPWQESALRAVAVINLSPFSSQTGAWSPCPGECLDWPASSKRPPALTAPPSHLHLVRFCLSLQFLPRLPERAPLTQPYWAPTCNALAPEHLKQDCLPALPFSVSLALGSKPGEQARV